MSIRYPRLFLAGLLITTSCGASAEKRNRSAALALPADGLTVRGDVRSPSLLRIDELQAMAAVTHTWSPHGQARQVTGVPLIAVLRRSGWEPGPEGKSVPTRDKHSGHRFVAIASAADGYQAVFTAAELTEGKTEALVVWSIDGKALSAESGPLRLVVPTDSGMSRSAFQLRSVDVVDVRKLVP